MPLVSDFFPCWKTSHYVYRYGRSGSSRSRTQLFPNPLLAFLSHCPNTIDLSLKRLVEIREFGYCSRHIIRLNDSSCWCMQSCSSANCARLVASALPVRYSSYVISRAPIRLQLLPFLMRTNLLRLWKIQLSRRDQERDNLRHELHIPRMLTEQGIHRVYVTDYSRLVRDLSAPFTKI